MDALTSNIQGLAPRHSRCGTPHFTPRDELLAKIHSCLGRIPSSRSNPSAPLTLEKLRTLSSPQLIETFRQFCRHGYQAEALDYLQSYQQLFKGNPQFQAAYFQIAREFLQQGKVDEAILIVETDWTKQRILDEVFSSASLPDHPVAVEKLAQLIVFARSFHDKMLKENYLLQCAVHFIHCAAYQEAAVVLSECTKSFESRFGDLFALCPDWNILETFAGSLNNANLRDRCFQLCRDYRSSHATEEVVDLNVAGKRAKNGCVSSLKRARIQ
ncbi:MAG: hypothetical protein LLG04_11205 [Parachlamydia sp.]|nr:hypothetical protein [Parachlamydia sp.]